MTRIAAPTGKWSAARLAILALAGLALAYAARVALWRPLPVLGDHPADGWVRVGGVVHVHTTLSDGGGTPEEVVKAARLAGLRFVAITDHGHADAKPREGYHEGVLLLVGTEISTTAGHLLSLGNSAPSFRFSGDPLDALDDIHELGGLAFAAHPDSQRPELRFTGWSLPGPWGIELVNGDSQWRAAGWAGLARTAMLYPLSPRYSLLATLTPPLAALDRWDRLLQERDVPGIAGADAHSRIPLPGGRALRFPSYAALFDLLRVFALLPEPLSGHAAADTWAVLTALRAGRSYMAVEALAPADGFSFTLEGEAGRFTMGDTAPPAPSLKFRAGGRLPAGARLRLLKDGRPLVEQTGRLEWPSPGLGVYRVEVYVPGWRFPWVISNSIVVCGGEQRRSREQRAAWPLPPEPSTTRVLLDGFEGPSRFATEHDPGSAVEAAAFEPGGGVDGRVAARLAFRLGAFEAPPAPTYCSLIARGEWDLAGAQDLLFWIRADGVYRVRVELRDRNPASGDDGVEFWSASVRTTTSWRRVALPIARFRSINPRSDGRLDLDQIREIAFVIDKGTMPLGSHGGIWLDELGTD